MRWIIEAFSTTSSGEIYALASALLTGALVAFAVARGITIEEIAGIKLTRPFSLRKRPRMYLASAIAFAAAIICGGVAFFLEIDQRVAAYTASIKAEAESVKQKQTELFAAQIAESGITTMTDLIAVFNNVDKYASQVVTETYLVEALEAKSTSDHPPSSLASRIEDFKKFKLYTSTAINFLQHTRELYACFGSPQSQQKACSILGRDYQKALAQLTASVEGPAVVPTPMIDLDTSSRVNLNRAMGEGMAEARTAIETFSRTTAVFLEAMKNQSKTNKLILVGTGALDFAEYLSNEAGLRGINSDWLSKELGKNGSLAGSALGLIERIEDERIGAQQEALRSFGPMIDSLVSQHEGFDRAFAQPTD